MVLSGLEWGSEKSRFVLMGPDRIWSSFEGLFCYYEQS